VSSILLIDDDAEFISGLGRFFERRGWTVSGAAGAAAGIEVYEREQPDLVLLDLGLPDLPGLDLLRTLRERDADATILVLTGNAAAGVDAMRLGAENFLTRPIEFSHLEAATERALEKAALRRRNRLLAGRTADPPGLAPDITTAPRPAADGADVELSLEEVERRHIRRVLAHHAGNRSRAARALGISRATLYEKIRRYGLAAVGRPDASS